MSKPYYEDEFVTLFHGDCLEITDWLDADVLITDPPYGENRSLDRANETKVTNDHNTEARDSALALWGSKKGSLVFGTWKCERPKVIKHLVVWDKMTMSLGDQTSAFATSHEEIYIFGDTSAFLNKRQQTVIRYKVPKGDFRPNHPTPKPVGLMEELVLKTGVGLIADPFAGSGTTLIAARNLGRKVIGVELEEKYCEMIAKRLLQQAFNFEELQNA